MPDLHSLPPNWEPTNCIRNNGPDHLALERYKLRELAEGWPLHRDHCEWSALTSIFHPAGLIYTTWTGLTHHLDFIAASQRGMDAGAFIMHRVHGTTTEIPNVADPTRAVTKMKATITQRFSNLPCGAGGECAADAEADCRFLFLWEKIPLDARGELENMRGEWRARYVRHWYEKDKLIPVHPGRIPVLDEEKLGAFPCGYRFLGYCQEATMAGVKVLKDMPGHVRERGTVNGEKHDLLYQQAKEWLEGNVIDF